MSHYFWADFQERNDYQHGDFLITKTEPNISNLPPYLIDLDVLKSAEGFKVNTELHIKLEDYGLDGLIDYAHFTLPLIPNTPGGK